MTTPTTNTTAIKLIDEVRSQYNGDRLVLQMVCGIFLAGSVNSPQIRQEVIKYTTGQLKPITKCTLPAVTEALQNYFNQSRLF